MTVETQPAMAPPNTPTKYTATQFPDDEIREIGDRIAGLTILEAKELSDYLETQGIPWKPKLKPNLLPGYIPPSLNG